MLPLAERTIIYFEPFFFKNGNSKNKYFLVLKNQGDKIVLTSLPTSQNKVPFNLEIEYGCIDDASINFNCFVISKDTLVTEDDKQFVVKTYLYGYQLDTYEVSDLKDTYQLENIDYHIWGKMREDIFKDLIACIINSKSVKKKFIRMLTN